MFASPRRSKTIHNGGCQSSLKHTTNPPKADPMPSAQYLIIVPQVDKTNINQHSVSLQTRPLNPRCLVSPERVAITTIANTGDDNAVWDSTGRFTRSFLSYSSHSVHFDAPGVRE